MKRFSKFLAILTTLVLLSCPLFSAFANSQLTPDGQVTQSQTGETWFYDAIGNRVEASTLGENNALVQVSKSVQSTGTENEFEVTLNVTTEEDLTTLSKSNHAAVLLVLDYSGSMEYAMGSATRMVALKKAANAFLQTFAMQTGATGTDERLAAAVIFDQDAHLHMPWINLRSTTVIDGVETSNLNLAQSRIESITSHSGTNIEGGMHAAASYMNSSRQHGRELENVDYLYTILITDGQPGTGSPYDEDRKYLEILMDTNKAIIRGTAATSDMGGFDYVDTVGDAADVIKGLSKMSEVYGVCLDVSNSNLFASAPNAEQQKKLNPSFDKVITIGEWFQLFCDHFYPVSGDNAAGLNDAFSSIATKIQTGTSAFRLQDTMGTDVKYLGAADSLENVVEANGDSFVWDLRNSPRTKQTISTDNVDTTVYNYTYKYKTRLDNLAAGFAANTPAAVNDNSKTELEYISTGTDGRWQTNTIYKVKLPVPKVQGYSCDLSFTKVQPDGVSPLAGAKFTLTHNKADCTCSLNTSWTQDFTSLADGKVSFSDIPSGHVYTLAEIPPTGYASPGTLRVSTVLGTATLSGTGVSGSAGSYVVKNDEDKGLTGNLKITKAFSGHSASEDVSFVVEKTSTDGIPYSTTVTLSAANNWTTQLYSIPSGTYVVKEVLSDVQFKDYDHTVSVKVDNVSAQVVEDSTHASVSLTVPTLGGTVAADFTNQYTAHTGKIVIRKSLTQTGEENYMAANGAADLAEIKAGLSYVIGNAEGGTYQSLVYSDLKPVSGQDYVEYTVTLPVGKYTLQETDYKNSKYLDVIDNFTFTLTDGQTKYHLAQGDTINGFITETSESVYVDRDETVLIHYTNNYVLCSGELEIRKFFHGVPDELKAPTQAKNLAFTYQNNSYESVTGNIGYQNFTASSSYDETHGNNYRYYQPKQS